MNRPLYTLPNIPGFIAFRVFFNARFYYPVFALMFLEFGLNLSQFSLSNLIWAAAIVTLEVPSGALADVIGRRKLVLLAAFLMILEMGVLLVAQPHSGGVLLFLFALNRFLSGAGEAMASGADEALAYDTLKECGEEDRWSEVLAWQTRLSSIAFFLAMLIGAAVYDPRVINQVGEWVGWHGSWDKSDTLKLPIWLTFGNGILALLAALTMKPLKSETGRTWRVGFKEPLRKVKEVALDVFHRKEVMAVIFAAVVFDQAARASMTMSSKTFTAYGIEEVWFGVIGAGMALVGAVIAGPARRLAEGCGKGLVFLILVALSLLGLIGQSACSSAWGIAFLLCLSAVMSLIGFLASYYLNRLADSDERATLLSYKGLACNLGFGAVSLYYSGVSSIWRVEEGRAYLDSLYSLPIYFGIWVLGFCLWKRRV